LSPSITSQGGGTAARRVRLTAEVEKKNSRSETAEQITSTGGEIQGLSPDVLQRVRSKSSLVYGLGLRDGKVPVRSEGAIGSKRKRQGFRYAKGGNSTRGSKLETIQKGAG